MGILAWLWGVSGAAGRTIPAVVVWLKVWRWATIERRKTGVFFCAVLLMLFFSELE